MHEESPALSPVRVATLIGAYLNRVYNGIENVLKQVAVLHGLPLPTGERDHADLLAMSGPDAPEGVPLRLDADPFDDVDAFRRFRHVFRTSFSAQLSLDHLRPGALASSAVVDRFEEVVRAAVLPGPSADQKGG